MKLLGVCLIILGSGGYWLVWDRRRKAEMALYRSLLQDLAVLGWNICVRRRSLPDIAATCFPSGAAAERFWLPLLRLLERQELPLNECWRKTAAQLPEPLAGILSSLGELLGVGGNVLQGAIDETREELAGYLQERQRQEAQQGRLAAALCVSGALMLILVLL